MYSNHPFLFIQFSIQPPRIGGVKVYTDNVRDQIMMDIEVLYVRKDQLDTEERILLFI